MKQARKEYDIKFVNHDRRAKKRVYAITYPKKKEDREASYRDLLKVTHWTIDAARQVVVELRSRNDMMANAIATELERFCDLGIRIVDQTTRRIIDGKSLPPEEKLVSIFETHTDILVKGARKVEYGHKVSLSTGASGLVTDVMVLDGNPGDVTLTKTIVERHVEIFGRPPRQAAFDGAFASKANLASIKEMGARDVVFGKPCGLGIHEMAKSTWVFKCLRNFRTAIEGRSRADGHL